MQAGWRWETGTQAQGPETTLGSPGPAGYPGASQGGEDGPLSPAHCCPDTNKHIRLAPPQAADVGRLLGSVPEGADNWYTTSEGCLLGRRCWLSSHPTEEETLGVRKEHSSGTRRPGAAVVILTPSLRGGLQQVTLTLHVICSSSRSLHECYYTNANIGHSKYSVPTPSKETQNLVPDP